MLPLVIALAPIYTFTYVSSEFQGLLHVAHMNESLVDEDDHLTVFAPDNSAVLASGLKALTGNKAYIEAVSIELIVLYSIVLVPLLILTRIH